MRISKFKLLLVVLLIFTSFSFHAPANAAGASLYLAPSAGTYVIGSRFTVSVKVNSGGEVINASEGTISFDNNLLEAVGISKSGAVFSLWTTEPTFSNSGGTISFGGGIPRTGYSGTAGQICSITFRTKKVGTAQVRFTSGAVLANDGKGTNILASMGSGSYTISPRVAPPQETGKNQPAAVPEKPAEPEYNTPTITSPTHPDQNVWYRETTVKLEWTPPEGVTDVSLSFNQESVSDPGPVSDGLLSKKEYNDVKDGVWYFHLKYKDSKRWGTAAHYRVMIDTVAPHPFEVGVEKAEPGNWPTLDFKTTDDGSGLAKYDVFIDSLETRAHELTPDKETFEVSGLDVGKHTALVKAVDKAGNETIAMVDFEVEPIEAPVITNYADNIKSDNKFFMNGTSLPDVNILVFIQKDGERIAEDIVRSDGNGNWFYLNKDGLPNARYVAWAEAKNDKGIKSGPSAKITFLVSPPIFTRFGNFVVNYFTVFVSLLFLILLIIFLVLYLAGWIRKKLKKETVEVEEVLHKNLTELKKVVDDEFKTIDKAAGGPNYKEEKKKAEERLQKNIGGIEKRIYKEIKDIEDILK